MHSMRLNCILGQIFGRRRFAAPEKFQKKVLKKIFFEKVVQKILKQGPQQKKIAFRMRNHKYM